MEVNIITANERHAKDYVEIIAAQIAAVRELQEEGKIRRLGKLLILAIIPILTLLPADITTLTAIGGTVPPIPQRISPWATENNIYIEELGRSPIPGDAETVYLLKDVFTTINGSWEVTDERWSIPQWARDAYLTAEFDDAGGDHHLFAAVLGEDGKFMRLKEIVYWSDGFESVNDPAYDDYVFRETKEHSGWINIPIFSGSSYAPELGESGPWCWMPTAGSETICGGGLPSNRHVSTFAVWQAVPANVTPPPDYDNAVFLPSFVYSQP